MSNHNACHTWLYMKISSITEDELIKFIDCAINERSNRSYMQCTSKEFAMKLKKAANSSWGHAEIIKYTDINEGISRYSKAVELNKKWIDTLITAKENLDYSILYNKSLFEHHPIFQDYIYLDMDNPFKYCGYTHATYTKKEDVIKFLWKCNSEFNLHHISYDNCTGMSHELEYKIDTLYNTHGISNLLIEFAP